MSEIKFMGLAQDIMNVRIQLQQLKEENKQLEERIEEVERKMKQTNSQDIPFAIEKYNQKKPHIEPKSDEQIYNG